MQIKANAEIGDVILSNLKLKNIVLKDFTPIQKQCSQCLQEIKAEEEVLIIFVSKKSLVLDEFPLNEPYIVHATPQNGKYCTEDFLARLMAPVAPTTETTPSL